MIFYNFTSVLKKIFLVLCFFLVSSLSYSQENDFINDDTEEIENEEHRRIVEIVRRLDEEYNSKKEKQQALQQAKEKRDEAKEQNDKTKQLENQVSEELEKRGKNHEQQ